MKTSRQLFDVALQTTQGSRFAPTGFPDLGAAEFDRPTADGWEKAILVESAQSMANRLEATLWQTGAHEPIEAIGAIPYVRIVGSDGQFLTSSRLESHRLASPYVRYATVGDRSVMQIIGERLALAKDRPHDVPGMARGLFSLDPLVLIHGIFFAGKGSDEFPGQPKFARATTAFIEAHDVRRAESGGVKRDHVNHTQESSGGDSSEGYGSVPFQRTEWTARSIVASFSLDIALLASYQLPVPAFELLVVLAKLEIRTLIDQPLRLRSNCDFEAVDTDIATRDGTKLPSYADLAASIPELLKGCAAEGLFDDPVPEAVWTNSK